MSVANTVILLFLTIVFFSETKAMLMTSHRRLNILTNEWVLVSPGRGNRPWNGKLEPITSIAHLSYDPSCTLCPGNKRATNIPNPAYTGIFVFDNDYPALKPDAPQIVPKQGLLVSEPEQGICRVVCFSARHNATIASMSLEEINNVVNTWYEQYKELSTYSFIKWIQIFENRGEIMGCSNPHPHAQIWATSLLPNEATKELAVIDNRSTCVLCDYVAIEQERIVYTNKSFIAAVPFWAVWPFEVIIISRRHTNDLVSMNENERKDLAEIMQKVTQKYDALFDVPFPYTMGLHQMNYHKWHFHIHYYPPLLRSATIRKFMVGYEMLAMPQRDLTPESAAERLRACKPH